MEDLDFDAAEIENTMTNAFEAGMEHPSPCPLRAGLLHWRAWAVQRVRPGRTSHSDVRVLEALVGLAGLGMTAEVEVSIRRLKMESGVRSNDTLYEALDRLQECGLIEKLPKTGRTSVWGLVGVEETGTKPHTSPSMGRDKEEIGERKKLTRSDDFGMEPSHDFRDRRRGLNDTEADLYRVLRGEDRPLAEAELIEDLGCCERTVKDRLRSLADLGLADRDVEGRWVGRWCDPDQMAEEMGSAGRRELQEEINRRDSELYLAWRTAEQVRVRVPWMHGRLAPVLRPEVSPYEFAAEQGGLVEYLTPLLARRWGSPDETYGTSTPDYPRDANGNLMRRAPTMPLVIPRLPLPVGLEPFAEGTALLPI